MMNNNHSKYYLLIVKLGLSLAFFLQLLISGYNHKVLAGSKCINYGDNIKDLSNDLIKDIPDYANRVIQRNRIFSHPLDFLPLYVITAGNTELEKLPLSQSQYQNLDLSHNQDNIKQIFFTTLERQYTRENRAIETQNFHWLLLTKKNQTWYVVMLLTKLGYPQESNEGKLVTSPPLDTTQGIIGQAINLWLRDCQWQD